LIYGASHKAIIENLSSDQPSNIEKYQSHEADHHKLVLAIRAVISAVGTGINTNKRYNANKPIVQ
jgi:hypothetical protein